MRRSRLFASLLLAAFAASAAGLAADLAPGGTLRAAFLGLNPVQGKVDPVTGAVSGPVADLVVELARRLHVPYKILPEPDARHVIDDLKTHSADIGFLAYDPARGAEVDFSEPYALMFNALIVRADSDIRASKDADRTGFRVGAVKGQTQQLFLSGTLRQASVTIFDTMPSQAELEVLFEKHELDAFGVNRQRAEQAAAQSSKIRALADNFLTVEQDIVVEKDVNKGAGKSRLEQLNLYLDGLRASGFVKESLARAKISGVAVAPAKAPKP